MAMRTADTAFADAWAMAAMVAAMATSGLAIAACYASTTLMFALFLVSIGPLLVALTLHFINRRYASGARRRNAEMVMAGAGVAMAASAACWMLM